MNKQDITDLLFERLGLSKRESKDLVSAVFDILFETIVRGERVSLSMLGSFRVDHKSSRPGHHFVTGESVMIKARKVVKFKASQKIRISVKSSKSCVVDQ